MKSVTDRVEQMKRSYSRQLPGRIRDLEETWRQIAYRHDPEGLAMMLEGTHNLAGSGGVYGYPRVSTLSRELHRILRRIEEEQRAPHDEERRRIEQHLEALLREVTPR